MSHSEETKKKISEKVKEFIKLNPNKYKKNLKYRISKCCLNCKSVMKLRPSDIKKFCSLECRKHATKNGYLKGKTGGLRKGSGRSKSGWYKGYYCNSSYELAWVIYSLDNGLIFERNLQGFDYINLKGTISKYYPDFYITDLKSYVEIKGFKEKEFENKQRSFKEKILIIDKKEIKPIIQYVKNKYGKNFIELYENNPYKLKNNNCIICNKPAKFKYCSRICSGKGVRKIKDSIDMSKVLL